MGSHDEYGKRVLKGAASDAFESSGPNVEIDYGIGHPARIDGAVNGSIAVEIESRTSKQVRGAILDLICHRFYKKLLILLPVHMSNPMITAEQCRTALRRFVRQEDFRVIVLDGYGSNPMFEQDVTKTRTALRELGYE